MLCYLNHINYLSWFDKRKNAFFLQWKINNFIQQWCVKVLKSESKDFYNVTKIPFQINPHERDFFKKKELLNGGVNIYYKFIMYI